MEHQSAVKWINFVEYLEPDMSVHIMSFLDDPSDLVRACAVSGSWRKFITTKGLAKQLCVKTYPQFANVVETVVVNKPKEKPVGTKTEWEILKRDHRVFASLHWAVLKANCPRRDCVSRAVSATSSDRLPGVSVRRAVSTWSSDRPAMSLENTVKGKGILEGEYWSSKGTSDPTVPETLIYRMSAGIWVITEFRIMLFKIYSPKSVRFRLGHLRPKSEIESGVRYWPLDGATDEKFQWTYTSPEFPMLQGDLQQFVLPEPVLCVDGFLKIELLGRVKRHKTDGLFYLCLKSVRAMGRALHSAFQVRVGEPYGFKNVVLKHVTEDLPYLLEN